MIVICNYADTNNGRWAARLKSVQDMKQAYEQARVSP